MDIKNGNLIEDNPKIESSPRSNKVYFFIIAILALLATNAYYAIRYKNIGKQVEVLNFEKSQLEVEIDRIEAESNRVTKENFDLSASLQEQHDQAAAMIEDLRQQLNESPAIDQSDLLRTQQEIRKLRDLVSTYRNDLESLKKENKELTHENSKLQESVKIANENSEKLEEKNADLESKIKIASDLKISNMSVNSLNIKNNDQEGTETKARKVDKLKINFTLSNNPLAEVNRHNIYLRITEPSGNLITDGKTFKINNEEMQYTAISSINFKNDGKEYAINWSPNSHKFQKGTYTVILYTDKSVMGRSTVNLK